MEFGTILRKVGNSLGGDFKSLEDKRKEEIRKLEERLESAKLALSNVQGFASDPSNGSGGDHGAIVNWEGVIFRTKAELAALKNQN